MVVVVLVVLNCMNNLINLHLEDMVTLKHFQERIGYKKPEALFMFLFPVACNFLVLF